VYFADCGSAHFVAVLRVRCPRMVCGYSMLLLCSYDALGVRGALEVLSWELYGFGFLGFAGCGGRFGNLFAGFCFGVGVHTLLCSASFKPVSGLWVSTLLVILGTCSYRS
jgi:hypothetical protein